MTTNQQQRFPPDVQNVLVASGWFPGRSVEPSRLTGWFRELNGPGGYEPFPAAEATLREFGGLFVKQDAPGISAYRSSVNLDPSRAQYELGTFDDFMNVLGVKVFPVGELDNGQAILLLDELGRVFVHDNKFLANNFDEALINLIIGIMSKNFTDKDAPADIQKRFQHLR